MTTTIYNKGAVRHHILEASLLTILIHGIPYTLVGAIISLIINTFLLFIFMAFSKILDTPVEGPPGSWVWFQFAFVAYLAGVYIAIGSLMVDQARKERGQKAFCEAPVFGSQILYFLSLLFSNKSPYVRHVDVDCGTKPDSSGRRPYKADGAICNAYDSSDETSRGFDLTFCDNCKRTVLPKRDGTCPGCRRTIPNLKT